MHHHFYRLVRPIMDGQTISLAQTFFIELSVSLITLAVGSYVIPTYLDWRKKPHLEIVNPVNGNYIFDLTKSTDDKWEASIDFVIKNKGLATQKEWFWHLFVPLELSHQSRIFDSATGSIQHDVVSSGNKSWRHYFNTIPSTKMIYAKRSLKLNFGLDIKTSDSESREYKIYYYFVSEFGTWPRVSAEIEYAVESQNKFFNPECLAYVKLQPHV